LLGRSEDLDPALEQMVGRAVAEHVEWIDRFPSRYSSANNHRIAELTGLLVGVAAYPQIAGRRDIDRWWAELETAVQRLFHSDGVPAEQATTYGVLVLEWLAIALHLARRGGRTVAAATEDRIAAAAGFLVSVPDSGGNAVRFGDDDGSRLLTAARPPEELPTAVLDLVARQLRITRPSGRCGLATFAAGGYTVWRSGSEREEVLWVLDHGPLGMGHLAAHAHADTLAVYLHYAGMPVFVDAGTYLYHSDGHWRDQLPGTAAHNTVVVAGADSSTPAGPFNWRRGRRAEGRLVSARSSSTDWEVEAEHRGYIDRYGVVHRRWLRGLGPNRFRLTDRLEGLADPVPFSWSLLVAPGLDVVRTESGWLLKAGGTGLLSVELESPWQGSARTEDAWCSPAFGRLSRTRRLVIEGHAIPEASLEVDITLLTAPGHGLNTSERDA
jgi:hypothetical protein